MVDDEETRDAALNGVTEPAPPTPDNLSYIMHIYALI